jgi:hypothetical protein
MPPPIQQRNHNIGGVFTQPGSEAGIPSMRLACLLSPHIAADVVAVARFSAPCQIRTSVTASISRRQLRVLTDFAGGMPIIIKGSTASTLVLPHFRSNSAPRSTSAVSSTLSRPRQSHDEVARCRITSSRCRSVVHRRRSFQVASTSHSGYSQC